MKYRVSLFIALFFSWSALATSTLALKFGACDTLLNSLTEFAATHDPRRSLNQIRSQVEHQTGPNYDGSLEPILFNGSMSNLNRASGLPILQRLNALSLNFESNTNLQVFALEFRGNENIRKALDMIRSRKTVDDRFMTKVLALATSIRLWFLPRSRAAYQASLNNLLLGSLEQMIGQLPDDRLLVIGESECSEFWDHIGYIDGKTMEPVWIAIYRTHGYC